MKSKEEILKIIFNTKFELLVPSYIYKSQLFFVNDDEFNKLMKHKRIEDCDAEKIDTLVIGNYIFKLKSTKKTTINI